VTEDDKQRRRQAILDLISAASLAHPKEGWDLVAEKTGFLEKAIEITGSNACYFVDAIATAGLTRFDAVQEFCKAKRIAVAPITKKGNKTNAQPVIVKPEPKPAAPAAQPGNVVLPEPARPTVPPEARPDPNRESDKPAVAGPVGKPGRDPGVRRSVHRTEKLKPVALPEKQNSLF
jgi:hypothetical protein